MGYGEGLALEREVNGLKETRPAPLQMSPLQNPEIRRGAVGGIGLSQPLGDLPLGPEPWPAQQAQPLCGEQASLTEPQAPQHEQAWFVKAKHYRSI